MPTPGSPASSTTAPGTSPPPSTRSSSSTPVGTARAASTSTWPIGRAGGCDRAGAVVRTDRGRAVLVDRAPGLALAAAADPLGGRPAALGAAVGGALADGGAAMSASVGRTADETLQQPADPLGRRAGRLPLRAGGTPPRHRRAEVSGPEAVDQRLDLAGHRHQIARQLGLQQVALQLLVDDELLARGVHGGSAPMKTLNSSSGARNSASHSGVFVA